MGHYDEHMAADALLEEYKERYYDEQREAYEDAERDPLYLMAKARTFKIPDAHDTRHCAEYRTFSTGATRDTDEGKLDYEGFLCPLVLKAFAEYMHEKRKMPDGSMRASDNWQKGIPLDAYMKSMWRHFMDVWSNHRDPRPSQHALETELLALLFNVQGYLHEVLKGNKNV